MNTPFNASKIRRMSCLALAAVMTASVLSGCSLLTKKPSETSQDPTGEMPNLVENAEVTTEATDPVETVPQDVEIPENMAIVKEQLNVRSSPSTTYPVIATLDAGDMVEVVQVQPLHGVSWAQIFISTSNSYGWVTAESLDMSHVNLNEETTPAENGETPEAPEENTKPTEKPETNTTVSGNTVMGVVTASELNIRAEADSSSTRVGGLKYGDRVTVQEQSGEWGRIKQGWISMKYVYVDGNKGANTCSGSITASQLIVRSGPGTNYDKASTLNEGARVDVLEQIKVGDYAWGCISGGWIRMDYVNVTSGTSLAPTKTETNTQNTNTETGIGTATVISNGLFVRKDAGTNYDSVGALKNGETVTILEKKDVNGTSWGRISSGWICMDYVKMN